MVVLVTRSLLPALFFASRAPFAAATTSARFQRFSFIFFFFSNFFIQLNLFVYFRGLATMAAEAFTKHEVIPDVLASNPPSKVVSVKFNSGVEVIQKKEI